MTPTIPPVADDEAMRIALADEVEAARGFDNALDVRCEIALFEPAGGEVAIRPNAAGTKVVVTMQGGRERTFIARDFTISPQARASTAAALRASLQNGEVGDE